VGLRVEIDQDECMSSGKCVADHPDAFDFDDEELAVARAGAQTMTDDDKSRTARNCPSRAIMLFDSNGDRVEP
jgi:ferredoxin